MTQLAEEKLARARAIIRAKAPYIMTTVYGLVPVMIEGASPVQGTLGVTAGMVLAIDPDWFAGIEDKHAAAALVHECFHIINNHMERGSHFADQALANIAGDLVINPWIRHAGWELPHGVFPEDYGFAEGLMMEEYYQLLEKRKKEQQAKSGKGQGAGGGKPQPGDDKGQGKGQDGSGGQKPKDGGKDPQGPGQKGQGGSGGQPQPGQGQPGQGQGGGGGNLPGDKVPGLCAGKCGGVAANPASKQQDQKLDAEFGRSEPDQKRIVKQTLEEIKQHAESHGRGSVPAGLLSSIAITEEQSEIPWQAELAHILKKCTGLLEAGGMDYSLARPSKRSYARGFPRPGLVQYQPEVAFVFDTSASMGTPQLIATIVESCGIMRRLGLESVWLLQADAAVAQTAKRIRLKDLMGNVKIHGRGGTNFDPALRAVEKLKPRPDLLVYFTDGDGHVTYRPKGIEVVWCVVRGHYNKRPPCDWGHAVIIADKGKMKDNFRAPRTA